MRALAAFAMSGRSQAALVAAGSAVLSLILPLVAVISSAVVALATLRQGAWEGLGVVGLAAIGSGGLAWLTLGAPLAGLGFLTVLWLPVWGLALVLRRTGRLALAVQTAALAGLLVLVGLHLAMDDPAVYWAGILEPLRASVVEGGVVGEAQSKDLIAALSKWMTGAFAGSLYVQFLLGLFLGRWWQGLLYNPGGFGAEFRSLRLSSLLGYAALGVGALRLGWPDAIWGYELLVLLVPLLFLQGMAVAHGVRQSLGVGVGWLVALYLLLVVAMPYSELLVAGVGLLDLWLDLRHRAERRAEGRSKPNH